MAAQHDIVSNLLSSNAQWAKEIQATDPEFLENATKGQNPHTLWIGCADSRVPEATVTGTRPGELFVHRNVANQLHLKDENALSVLRYAVDFLGVEHVVIVGHSECGGATACLAASQAPNFSPDGPIITVPSLPADSVLNRWLAPLTRLAASLRLSSASRAEALPIVVEENVKAQVENLCKTQTIQDAWTKGTPKGQKVWVHGWVYEIATGEIRDLKVSRGPPTSDS